MTARTHLAGVAVAAVLAAVLGVPPARGEAPASAASAEPTSNWREASLAEYRQHLVELNAVVEDCAKARDTKTCDPSLVGQDDHLPLGNAPNAERRLVRYEWLRTLLAKAQIQDEAKHESPDKTQNKSQGKTPGKPAPEAGKAPAKEPTLPPQPTTGKLLEDATARLTQDLAQADALAEGAHTATADHAREREAMKEVLAGRDFRALEAPTARDSVLEKLGAWLNQLLASAAMLQVHAAWVGRVLIWGFVLAVCVGLAWGLLQLERRWRIRLVPESGGFPAGAASARDWQLYLADARRSAAAGLWREAIHFVYWAAISRLEAKRLWPTDRARTPREYLALVAPEDPRRARLATLTASFERTWYGGRAAAEADYQKADELAAGLIAGSASPGAGAAEGGAR